MKELFKIPLIHRRGLLALFLLLLSLQICIFCYEPKISTSQKDNELLLKLEREYHKKLTERMQKQFQNKPFNPNFLTDYKAYMLGIPTEAYDKLQAFRKQGKYVNSAADFQRVTGISNQLLTKIKPLFSFPEWTQKKRNFSDRKTVVSKIDLNAANFDELLAVPRIGESRANQILKIREKLGRFVSVKQLKLLYGIDEDTYDFLQNKFVISTKKPIKKLAINSVGLKELAAFPHFNFYIAKEIVKKRSKNGALKPEDLANVQGLTTEQIEIIVLYLDFY
jgi:DNA uptake protein ComE-like DNA-binding protein